MDAALLLQQVQSSIARDGTEPCDELALPGIIRAYLPEGFLETPAADVVHIQIVEIWQPALYESPQGLYMEVPQGRESRAVAGDGLTDQIVNGIRASLFHSCILQLMVRRAL